MEDSPGGSQAQTWTYNTLIKGLGRELLVEEAFEVARSMVDRGCVPDKVYDVWVQMKTCCVFRGMKRGQAWWGNLLTRSCGPYLDRFFLAGE